MFHLVVKNFFSIMFRLGFNFANKKIRESRLRTIHLFLIIFVLQESILLPENSNYIKHSFDSIVESLLDLLHISPNSIGKLECAKCLGKIGYTLENNCKMFLDWLFDKFGSERNDEVRVLLMKSLLETLMLEKEKPVLKDFSTVCNSYVVRFDKNFLFSLSI